MDVMPVAASPSVVTPFERFRTRVTGPSLPIPLVFILVIGAGGGLITGIVLLNLVNHRPGMAQLLPFAFTLIVVDFVLFAGALMIARFLVKRTFKPLEPVLAAVTGMTQDRFNLEQPPQLPNADAQAIVNTLWAYGRTLSHPERTYAIELRQWQQRYAQARGVIDLIAEMNQALGLQALLERLAHGVSRFFAGDGVGIFLGNGSGLRLCVAVAEQFPAQLAGSDEWVAGVLGGQVRQVQMGHPRNTRPALATRLADARGNPIGVLILAPTKRADYTAEEIAFLQTVVGYAALAIQNALAYDQTDALSRIDALTGLFNRREFDRLLAQEFARATRYARFLSLIMVDIDHFKKINDQRGHPAGDWALQKVGELMRATRLRSSDGAFRIGGEEFVVMLTETDKAGALAYAERLRQTAEKMQIFPDGAGLTISLGVATFPEDAREPAQLVARADKALYEAKHTGRNVVVPA